MKYVEAPEKYKGKGKSIFLAGTITGALDWQSSLAEHLKKEALVILNPRRKNFPMGDTNAAEAQITWEFEHLRKATAISFWFSKETLAPITLYELGTWSMTKKPIFVGVDPDYPRKKDVEIHTKLARPDVKIVYNLNDLSRIIKKWAKGE
jgi:hypothetical protein